MKLTNIDRSDNRTIELAFEAAPHIQRDLQPLLERLDQDLGSKGREIEELKEQIEKLKQEIYDLEND